MTRHEPQDVHALRVLRAIVELESRGDDPYDVADAIAEQLDLTPETLEACLKCLVTGGYIYGGAYFSGPYVEGTTARGRRAVATWRTITAALDHVLDQVDVVVENDDSQDIRSRAWSQATRVRASDLAADLDMIGALIDLERDDEA